MKRRLLLLFWGIGFFGFCEASHIVGAELYYDCLGGNQYRITLKLYRNCSESCQECAAYGNPEYINIFDASGNLLQQVGLPLPSATPILSANYNNPCLILPDVCVQQAIYTGTVTLPPIEGGYNLVYQRCCRPVSVSNIYTTAGATYITHIPGTESFSCDNPPRFNNFPPIFICVNAGLVFNHSATDPDGDSLVYSLVTPYTGGDDACPDPSPAASGSGCPTAPPPPPYLPVSWISPFGATNPLNNPSNSNNLSIDPQTGVLTGTPNQIGQYVVGVHVDEYRNGVLIGGTTRDFQFNVSQCNIPITNIPSSDINPQTGIGIYRTNCDNYTISFSNNTYNPPPTSTPLSYRWNFGVAGVSNDTSNAATPVFTYPDSGTYLVTLIATKGTCVDSTHVYVKIYPTFDAKFGFTAASQCLGSTVYFSDSSFANYGTVNSWQWNFGDGTSSTLRNPSKTYTSAGTYTVRLTASSSLGCTDTFSKTVTIFPKSNANFSVQNVCINDTLHLANSSSNAVSYQWNFGNGTVSSVVQPTTVYTATGTYTIKEITTSINGCKDSMQKTVTVFPLPVVAINSDAAICDGSSIQLSASGGSTYVWSPSSSLNNANISNPVASPTATTRYTVTVSSVNNCKAKDSVTITVFPNPVVDAGKDTSVCLSQASTNTSVQLGATGGIIYSWSPIWGLSSANVPNPIATPTSNTVYFVTATDANGCSAYDSVAVLVLNPAINLIIETDKDICEHDTTRLTVYQENIDIYSWEPPTGLSNASSSNPLFFPTTTTTYICTVENYCYTKSDTATIIVHLKPTVDAGSDTTIYRNTSAQLNGTTDAATFYWTPSTALNGAWSLSPTASPMYTTTYFLYAISDYECTTHDSVRVTVEGRTVMLIPTAFSPNDDGKNDVFRIALMLNIERFNFFAVFNRWGEKIFETSDPSEGWDGTFRDLPQPLDVYMWVVDAQTYDGEKVSKSGNVTLLR